MSFEVSSFLVSLYYGSYTKDIFVLTGNISQIVSLVPEIERLMNYSFDVTKLFSSE